MRPGRTAGGGYSDRLAEVLNQVFGDLSQLQLEKKVGGDISGPTFGRLRMGRIGSPATHTVIARHFQDEFTRLYAREITEAFGACNLATINQWLRSLAMPELQRPSIRMETGSVDLRGFDGVTDLPAEDLDTLGAIIRAFITERRRARGLD